MRLLAILALVFTASLAALGVTIGQARGEALPPLPYELGRCGAQPCMMGIVPGVTPWRDAVLKAMAGSITFSQGRVLNTFLSFAGQGRIQMALNGDGAPTDEAARVRSILAMRAEPNHGMMRLGELIQHFGPPCHITVIGFDRVDVFYEKLHLVATAPNGHLAIDSTVDVMVFADSSPEERRCAPQLGEWRGFASLSRYSDWAVD